MKITQAFGGNGEYYRANGINVIGHNGLDLEAVDGANIYASHDGEVTFTGYDGSGGLGVVIRTLDKFDYQGKKSFFKTIYWHLKKDSIVVKANQKVKAGQLIALADNTGFSTGSHLHFGLKPITRGEKDWQWYNLEPNNGYSGAINPLPFFEGSPYLFEMDMFFDKGEVYNHEVELFQDFLLSEGLFNPIPPEEKGFYGNKTREAVFKFQNKYVGLSWWEKYVGKGDRIGPKTRKVANTVIINKFYK